MRAETFYVHCREGGLKLTQQDATDMRTAWVNTFYEMKDHMNPEPIADERCEAFRQMGYLSPEEEDEEEEPERRPQLYIARCINGMVRNRASRNAACNCQFQSLVAYGAKLAGWKLLYEGCMEDRLCAFIHDEYLYNLWPEELDPVIPQVEKLMLDGMRIAIPDVTVKVETTCSYHWDKKATVFQKLKRDGQGRILIEEPELVRRVYERAGSV